MLPFRHDSLLGKAVKDAIGATKAPELSRVDARSITPGQEYVFVSPASSSDPVTQVPWTRRRISVDLGEFISPNLSLFETTADATGVIPIVDVYTGENGNISQHFDDTPLFAVYSAKVYNDGDDTLFAALRVETQCSIWIGVDATGVADTVITTTPYADNSNAHTSAVLPLPTGWSEVDIGVYRQSGSMDFSITGDLAVQVAKIEAPDKTPPSDVSSLTQESWSSPHSVLLSWDWPTDSPDLVGAVIYKGSIAAANLRQTVLFDKTQVSCQVVVGGFTPGETATLYVRTFDSEGNYSDGVSISATSISGSLYFDSVAPATPTGLDATTGVTADALAKAWIKLTWNRSSEADMARYLILKRLSSDSYYWALAAVSEAATEMSFTDISITNGSSYDYQLVAEDKSGNRSSACVAQTIVAGDTTPPGVLSDFYIDDVSKSFSTAYSIAGQSVKLTWLNPSDTDLRSIRIYISRLNTGTAAARWADARDNFGVRWELGAKPAEYQTWSYIDKEALNGETSLATWIFFVPVDINGNFTSSTPQYTKLTFASADNQTNYGTTITPSTAANQRGWWKADFNLVVSYTGGIDTISYQPVAYSSYPQSTTFMDMGSAPFTAPITSETAADGSWFAAYIKGQTATGVKVHTDVARLLVKLDKTAPTAPTSLTATNVADGVQLSWTEGADSISGLRITEIYRNTSNSTGGTLIAAVDAGTALFIDKARLEGGRTYYYSVRHLDNADNNGTYSSVASIKIYPPEVGAHVNWLDNSSFERSDGGVTDTWKSWSKTGSPVEDTNFYHGSKGVQITSANKVTQEGLPLIGTYYQLSLYATSGATPKPTIKTDLVFKDLSGTTLQTITLESAAVTSSFARYSASGAGTKWVIAPTGESPAGAYEYNPSAATMDVTYYTDGSAASLDAVMVQEVSWDGADALSVETLEAAPTTYYDSRVLNYDRINAWVGRFALLTADHIDTGTMSADRVRAGILESTDGSTYVDLDNDLIHIEHSTDVYTEMDAVGMRKTMDGGSTYYQYPAIKRHTYSMASPTGTFNIDIATNVTYGQPIDVTKYVVVGVFALGEDGDGDDIRYPVVWSGSQTGNQVIGYWYLKQYSDFAGWYVLNIYGHVNAGDSQIAGNPTIEVIVAQTEWSAGEGYE